MNGEGYLKSPDHAADFVRNLPITEIPAKYVIFKPIELVEIEKEKPRSVIFFTCQTSYLPLLYLPTMREKATRALSFPMQQDARHWVFILTEAESENPRAVVGLTDISAKDNIYQKPA